MINKEYARAVLGVNITHDVYGIVEDIIYVKEYYLFVVRKGRTYNAFEDVAQALRKGAFVVHEDRSEKEGFYVGDLARKLDTLLTHMYQGISDSFTLVAVCGTNGKSSVVSYLYEMMSDKKCMKIGTHFIESADFHWYNENTTPSEITLLHLLQRARECQVEYIFMEVSSHAIDQGRIARVRFDYLVYTNIDRDHLDYHKTVLHYRYTKYKLVHYMKEQGVIIANGDELYYQELKQCTSKDIVTYGFNAAHFQICDASLSTHDTTFYVNRFYFHTHLLARINVYNVCACIALLRCAQVPYYEIYKKAFALTPLAGRLEVIYDQDFIVFVDYAHSAKAFYEVLTFLSMLTYRKLILVVGCGGDREVLKRSEIGYYSSCYCDECIFTEDNSRYESVYQIMEDMCLRVQGKAHLIRNREKAIEYAVKIAEKNDIILVSGKGDEHFLDKEGERVPFNDKETLLKLLE